MRNDDALALVLAAGATAAEAAAKTGVSERTVSRRVAEPAFRRRVQDLRGEMVAQALGRMANGMSEAADVLRSLLTAESENVRLSAARSILELGSKLRESVELEARLQALEASVASEENEGRAA